jgi:hypothetical protein
MSSKVSRGIRNFQYVGSVLSFSVTIPECYGHRPVRHARKKCKLFALRLFE